MPPALENRPRVLVVEDEAAMRRFLRTFLASEGYQLDEATNGRQAVELAGQHPPDLVVLDLGLPDMDGQEVLQLLREWLLAPIIVLSVRDQDTQKITALDNGADDYLTKPFSTGELLARVRGLLRRSIRGGGALETPLFEVGELRVDFIARQVFVGGAHVHLTPMEYKLLATLIQHGGRVLTHPFLLENIWGPREEKKPQLLRVLMAGLRRKVETDPAQPRYLLTEQGVGYRLAAE